MINLKFIHEFQKSVGISIIELCMNFKISPSGLAMQLVTKPWGCAAQGDANKLMAPEDYNNKIKNIIHEYEYIQYI